MGSHKIDVFVLYTLTFLGFFVYIGLMMVLWGRN